MVAISEILPNINFPSTIGNEYGDIYESQFAQAKNSIQNRGQVEFFNKHMKQVIQLGKVAPKLWTKKLELTQGKWKFRLVKKVSQFTSNQLCLFVFLSK